MKKHCIQNPIYLKKNHHTQNKYIDVNPLYSKSIILHNVNKKSQYLLSNTFKTHYSKIQLY